MALKRKAITRDSPEADDVLLSDGSAEFDIGDLNGVLSQSDDSNDSGDELDDDSSDGSSRSESDADETDVTDEDDNRESNTHTKEKKGVGELANGLDEASDNEENIPNYQVTKDANGNLRFVYDEIDPVYDSDDSDAPVTTNTIGNIPLSYYDEYPHIGYTIDGKKISRPATREALDMLLDTIEVPEGWTGLLDPETGKPRELSKDELEMLKKIQMNEVAEDGFDMYPDMVEYFTGKPEIMPLSAAPEPKRRFVPSKHEAKKIMKLVRAIREGRIMPKKPMEEEEEDQTTRFDSDLWANETPRQDHVMHVPAPKLPPPGFDESYHPPPEYLPDEQEKNEWIEADDEDKKKEYLPTNYDSLRKVPAYSKTLIERFTRCLDLYLAPRVRRAKLDIDPESLLPKLPRPEELKPFPSACKLILKGHEGRVRSVDISPDGHWIASGGDDGVLRLWELKSGREIWNLRLSTDEAINVVRWRPVDDSCLVTVATGENVYLVLPFGDTSIVEPELQQATRDLLDAGWGYAATSANGDAPTKEPVAKWSRPSARLQEAGVLVQITVRSIVKSISWHRRGEYFATVSPKGQSRAVAIHALSKHLTQLPFRRLKGLAQTARFHPSKPLFFIATQQTVRSYDLAKQELFRIDQPGARWISSIDIHPGGNNLLVGSYDKRLLWHDLELDTKPHKTLRYHSKAIRTVSYHKGGLPLFADGSDDGTLQVFHGKVVNDMMENATIVPLKVLKGHLIKGNIGILEIEWHPEHPWIASAGADGTCRLWA